MSEGVAEQSLQTQEFSPQLKADQALTLLRENKTQEGIDVLKDIAGEKESDSGVLAFQTPDVLPNAARILREQGHQEEAANAWKIALQNKVDLMMSNSLQSDKSHSIDEAENIALSMLKEAAKSKYGGDAYLLLNIIAQTQYAGAESIDPELIDILTSIPLDSPLAEIREVELSPLIVDTLTMIGDRDKLQQLKTSFLQHRQEDLQKEAQKRKDNAKSKGINIVQRVQILTDKFDKRSLETRYGKLISKVDTSLSSLQTRSIESSSNIRTTTIPEETFKDRKQEIEDFVQNALQKNIPSTPEMIRAYAEAWIQKSCPTGFLDRLLNSLYYVSAEKLNTSFDNMSTVASNILRHGQYTLATYSHKSNYWVYTSLREKGLPKATDMYLFDREADKQLESPVVTSPQKTVVSIDDFAASGSQTEGIITNMKHLTEVKKIIIVLAGATEKAIDLIRKKNQDCNISVQIGEGQQQISRKQKRSPNTKDITIYVGERIPLLGEKLNTEDHEFLTKMYQNIPLPDKGNVDELLSIVTPTPPFENAAIVTYDHIPDLLSSGHSPFRGLRQTDGNDIPPLFNTLTPTYRSI